MGGGRESTWEGRKIQGRGRGMGGGNKKNLIRMWDSKPVLRCLPYIALDN